MRILLVEDNPADAELIRELLLEYPQHSFSVRHAGSLASALAALGDEGADLILLDLGLPDSQGTETVRAVRAAAQDAPIVVLTGLDDEDVGISMLQEGAQDYLAKGWMSGAVLVRSIRYAEERKRIEAELVRKNAELKAANEALAARKEELREREERLRRAQEIAHLGSWELADGRLSWSDEVYRIYGVRPQEFAATYGAYLESVHPEDRVRADAAYGDSVREGRAGYETEYRIVRRSDGAVRHVYERCTNLRDGTGRILRSEGIVHDITERKEHEDALLGMTRKLQRSNEDLERFAYVVSHDLQEPLRTVSSFAQLLERRYGEQLGPEAEEFIGFMTDGTARMSALITDLLEYSRISSRAQPFEAVDLGGAVETALENLAVRMEECGGRILCDPMPTVHADRMQMVRLAQNLLSNAIKFCPAGRAPIVKIRATRAGGDWLIRFEDNGIGIDAECCDQIFEVFQRLHDRSEYPGTGIGLAICRRIVERHGGRIWVEPAAGAGSAFCFTLPLQDRPTPSSSPD